MEPTPTSSASVLVSVVVPARDAQETIGRTLECLAGQDLDGPYEVIVVDDGSSDDTVEIARTAGVRLLAQEGRGPGAARNLGAREAAGAVLAFTDADCFPESGWLREGLAAMASADLVQGRVVPDPASPRRPFDHTIWVVRESGLYETANLFVRTELFRSLGGFEDWLDVGIGKGLGEDVWFGWKARRQRAETAFCERALVHHAVFPRRWRDFVLECRRLVYFPDLVRKVPELREGLLRWRLFLSGRTAAFDAALAGVLLAVLGLALGWGWAALLALFPAAPYALILGRRATSLGRYGPKVSAVEAMADAVGFGALAWGSARRRTPVL